MQTENKLLLLFSFAVDASYQHFSYQFKTLQCDEDIYGLYNFYIYKKLLPFSIVCICLWNCNDKGRQIFFKIFYSCFPTCILTKCVFLNIVFLIHSLTYSNKVFDLTHEMPFKPPERAFCPKCNQAVYAAEERIGAGKKWHKQCFKCGVYNEVIVDGIHFHR